MTNRTKTQPASAELVMCGAKTSMFGARRIQFWDGGCLPATLAQRWAHTLRHHQSMQFYTVFPAAQCTTGLVECMDARISQRARLGLLPSIIITRLCSLAAQSSIRPHTCISCLRGSCMAARPQKPTRHSAPMRCVQAWFSLPWPGFEARASLPMAASSMA